MLFGRSWMSRLGHTLLLDACVLFPECRATDSRGQVKTFFHDKPHESLKRKPLEYGRLTAPRQIPRKRWDTQRICPTSAVTSYATKSRIRRTISAAKSLIVPTYFTFLL
jgi:hypothetical protein